MASTTTVVRANLEEGVERLADTATEKVQRPLLCFVLVTLSLVVVVAGGGPMLNLLQSRRTTVKVAAVPEEAPRLSLVDSVSSPTAATTISKAQGGSTSLVVDGGGASVALSPSAYPPPPPPSAVCGNNKCEPPETIETCFADCPGVSTPPMCGEEPHSDPQGNAVVDGRGHHVKTAGECCDACAAHAAKYPHRACNSWVFCYMPHCWSADNGNTHLFGECWLKHQSDPKHPLYGQRGQYTDAYRHVNRDKHLNGRYPPASDKNSVAAMAPFGIVPGSPRNLSVPTHVSWTGGVMGVNVDLSVRWTTDADGTMRSSAGDVIVDYRPWESREQNLKRGVKPEQMRF